MISYLKIIEISWNSPQRNYYMHFFTSYIRYHLLLTVSIVLLSGCGATNTAVPDPEVTLASANTDVLSFSVKGKEDPNTRYIWSSTSGHAYWRENPVMLQSGVSQNLNYIVDADFSSVLYIEITCEIQDFVELDSSWVTRDTIIWEVKSSQQQQAPNWVGSAFVRNANDVEALEGMTSIEGVLLIDDISFDGLAFLKAIDSIYEGLIISNNPNIEDLSGLGIEAMLPNLTTLMIANNEGLISLGFENVESFDGSLSIVGSANLVSLSGFDNIQSIGGTISISGNDTLISLAGFDNIQFIGGYLIVQDNLSMTSLSGLENLGSIGSGLIIDTNPVLTSFSGMENLETVGGSVSVHHNESLNSLIGLESLLSIDGGIDLWSNGLLSSLSGLQNLQTISGSLFVYENSNLMSVGELTGLSNVDGNFMIHSNDILCNSNAESLLMQIEDADGVDGMTHIANQEC